MVSLTALEGVIDRLSALQVLDESLLTKKIQEEISGYLSWIPFERLSFATTRTIDELKGRVTILDKEDLNRVRELFVKLQCLIIFSDSYSMDTHQAGEILDLAFPLTRGCSDGLKEILSVCYYLPESERAHICSHALPFMRGIPSGKERARILQMISSIPREDREDIIVRSLPFIEEGDDQGKSMLLEVFPALKQMSELDHIRNIIRTIRSIPKEERDEAFAEVQPFMEGISYGFYKLYTLLVIRKLPKEERPHILAHVLPFIIEEGCQWTRIPLIQAVASIPREERGEILVHARPYDENSINVIRTILSIPKEERGAVLVDALLFVKSIETKDNIIRKISQIPKEERADIYSQVMLFQSKEESFYSHSQWRIFSIVSEISKEERLDICACALFLIEGTDRRIAYSVLREFSRFPKEERKEICNRILPFMRDVNSGEYQNERVLILKIVGRVSKEIRDRVCSQIQALMDSDFDEKKKYDFLLAVGWLPKGRIAEIFSIALPFMEGLSNVSKRWAIVGSIQGILKKEGFQIFDQAQPFTEGVCDGLKRWGIIEKLRSVPRDQREELIAQALPFAQGSPGGFHRLHDLAIIIDFPKEDRKNLCARIIEMTSDPMVRSIILDAIRYFAPGHQMLMLNTVSYLSEAEILSKTYFTLELICAVLSHNPDLQESTHDFLIHSLQRERNPERARSCATYIFRHLRQFLIMSDTHPLAQVALNVIIATEDQTNPKNPYTLFKKLTRFAQDPSPETPMMIYEGHFFRLSPQEIFIGTRDSISREEVLAVTRGELIDSHGLRSLLENLRLRVMESPHQEEILSCVLSMTGESLSLLCENLEDSFFLNLLNTGLEKEFSLKKAMLHAVLQSVLDLSSEIKEGELLSLQEETLLKVSSSIQNCMTGKSDGLVLTYHLLARQYKYSLQMHEDGTSAVLKAKAFVRETLQNRILDLMSSDNEMMRAMTESEGKILQLSHQAVYVKNRLGPHLKMAHSLQFDPHTHVLYDKLIEKSLPELFAIFYQHMKVENCIDSLVSAFNREDPLVQGPIYNGAIEMLEGRIDPSNICEVDPDTYKLSLKRETALELLISVGIFQPRN